MAMYFFEGGSLMPRTAIVAAIDPVARPDFAAHTLASICVRLSRLPTSPQSTA
jgi:hypothetical protein